VGTSDCVVIEGSNMAECHPVAFRWVMQAKLNGATIIHVDPRFTRTSAMADIYAPIRAGTDIAFLGGLIRYVIENEKYLKDYVVHYTNAPVIIRDDFKDTEDLEGVFSGLGPFKGDAINGFIGTYDTSSWQYKRGESGHIRASGAEVDRSTSQPKGSQGGAATKPRDGGEKTSVKGPGQPATPAAPAAGKFDDLVKAAVKPPVLKDDTLQDPRCVFQILRRHFSRYTPEMVEQVTGCPQATFLKVAEALTKNSNPERTSAFCYAVGWTQHTYGPQLIGTCATLQLLLGNMGRPGGGILALRGHATIQGSTDVPTLYHSIHGYMSAPSTLKKHETLAEYISTEIVPTGYWGNMPKFMVSYLKSMWGDAATPENDFGYGWHPRITGDHSHMPMMVAMADGKIRGMFAMGQNPAVGGQNARLQRKAMAKLEWLVVKDNFETETAAFWHNSPEVKNGELSPADIKTEVFFFPSAQVAEMDGTFTNTQRLIQWHHKAVDPPGDCRSDTWFTVHLGNRLKKLYEASTLPRDQGFKNLTWDFMPEKPEAGSRITDEPDVRKIMKEINGYKADGSHLTTFGDLKDDGSTTCASWIYSGVFPKPDLLKAAERKPDPTGGNTPNLGWGFSWPANRRLMYNRASARPDGTPWSERKKYIFWDGEKWTGPDVPDFAAKKAPNTPAKVGAAGMDALAGTEPFIMKGDGRGWLYVPSGLNDGPLPTHYEPIESPVKNPLYKQQFSPVLKLWKHPENVVAEPGDPKYPLVLTTYRLTEHHLSGAMSRWLPWLAELQPELFVELSPELAGEKGIKNLDFVKVTTPRGTIRAKALVTRRMRPMMVAGKILHHVGLPWHWGYQGVVTGDVVNNLSALVGDPNVAIHEGKAFVCNVERA
jgi:formate dehydrogenase major subunit